MPNALWTGALWALAGVIVGNLYVGPALRRWWRRRKWRQAVAKEPREPQRLTHEEQQHAAALTEHQDTMRSAHAKRFVDAYSAALIREGVSARDALTEARTIYTELNGWGE